MIIWHPCEDYFLPFKYQQINRRIRFAMTNCQRRGSRVLGLAALNKAEWLNHGGVDLLRELGDELHTSKVSHGDTMTAALTLEWVNDLRRRNLWNRKIFMIGSTSKIGRACCLMLAKQGVTVVMFTQSRERFEEIQNEAIGCKENLVFCSDLKGGQDCDLWITGKFKPQGMELLNAIPQNTTVVNFAVPDPLFFARKELRKRKDIVHMDAGTLAFDPSRCTVSFPWLLNPGRIYACMAGCIVHAAAGFPDHEIGAVNIDILQKYWSLAEGCGLRLPEPTSLNEPITLPVRRIEEV